jgi:hypothetical protein
LASYKENSSCKSDLGSQLTLFVICIGHRTPSDCDDCVAPRHFLDRKADCMGLLRAALAKAVEDNRELKRTTLLRICASVDELGILAANPALGKMPKIGRTDEANVQRTLVL